jgi:uracil-DNA glycosylase
MVMDKEKELEQVTRLVADCRRCPLYRTANKSVPGFGSANAKVFFIGEAPGFNEDQQGIPFCGQAGKLLDHFLGLANLTREEIFITNILKHRPPGNRDPQEEEIVACRPFLDRQIKIISPRVIITLGRFSLEKFLPGALISRVHGQPRFVDFAGKEYIVCPMYHPAASLRNGKIKALEEEDFIKLGQFLARLFGGRAEELAKEIKVTGDNREKAELGGQMKLI